MFILLIFYDIIDYWSSSDCNYNLLVTKKWIIIKKKKILNINNAVFFVSSIPLQMNITLILLMTIVNLNLNHSGVFLFFLLMNYGWV